MAVARREGAKMLFSALTGGGEWEVFGEAFQAVGFASRHENGLADMHVDDGLGELETKLSVVQPEFGERLAALQRAHGVVTGDGFVDERVGRGNGVEVVVEKRDLAGKKGAILDQFGDLKAAVAGGFEVQAAVVVALGDAVDAGGAADGGDALFER